MGICDEFSVIQSLFFFYPLILNSQGGSCPQAHPGTERTCGSDRQLPLLACFHLICLTVACNQIDACLRLLRPGSSAFPGGVVVPCISGRTTLI